MNEVRYACTGPTRTLCQGRGFAAGQQDCAKCEGKAEAAARDRFITQFYFARPTQSNLLTSHALLVERNRELKQLFDLYRPPNEIARCLRDPQHHAASRFDTVRAAKVANMRRADARSVRKLIDLDVVLDHEVAEP